MVAPHVTPQDIGALDATRAVDVISDLLWAELRSTSTTVRLDMTTSQCKRAQGLKADEAVEWCRDKLGMDLRFFQSPGFRGKEIRTTRVRVRKPLFGEDVYVTKGAFERYHAAAVVFWNELREQLPDRR